MAIIWRLFVGFGILLAHLVSLLQRCSNLNQGSLSDTRAPLCCSIPGLAVLYQFWPEGEESTLHRFHRVDAAAALIQKRTLLRFAPRLANPAHMPGPIDEASLKIGLRHAEKVSGLLDVIFRQVHVTSHFTAFAAAGLAGKADLKVGFRCHETLA